MVYEVMKFYKITYYALVVIGMTFFVVPCSAETYMHPERIYSFQYPKSWIIKKHKSSDMVWFAPSTQDGKVFCFSRPEKMTGSDSDKTSIDDIIKSNLEKGVLVEAIRAADPEAGKFETDVFNTANSVASRIIFESKDKNGDLYKEAMILTYNLYTGHTIDITCQSQDGKWQKYGEVFEKIQSSLRIYNQAEAQKMVGKDFVGDKNKWVLGALDAIRKNIAMLHLQDGSNIPSETAKESSKPLLPYEDAKRIFNRGIISGMAEYCGLDWQKKSFLPFMRSERAKGKWSDKEIAVIGALHGVAQGNTLEGLQRKGGCPAEFRKKTQAMLDSLQ